ncbi:MAG: hypothetical protein HOP15_09430 [Planctomycetes bacterium]|nr:hypothetical protein [Planctomycetota bacterium]
MIHALLRALALASLCGASTSACTSVARQEALDAKQARWRTLEVSVASDRVLWQLALLALQSQGYPLGAGTDPGARQLESGWKTDLQPFKGDGRRWRALVRMTPLEPGRWKLEARVKCERNQNLVTPLDPVRTEWEPSSDDEAQAQILLQHIRSRLQPELEIQPAQRGPKEAR